MGRIGDLSVYCGTFTVNPEYLWNIKTMREW